MALSRRRLFEDLGFVTPARSGAWIAARGREHAEATGAEHTGSAAPDASIRLNSNENPVGPSAAVLDAILASLPAAGRYPDKATISEATLVESIARANGAAAENVVWGGGSGELLAGAVRAFTSPAKPLVTAWPSFETPHQMAAKMGTPIKEVALDASLALDLDTMIAASTGAGLVFFCNPNNPTGTVHGEAAVKDFVAKVHAASPDTVILLDEAYHDYVTDPSYKTGVPLAISQPNLIVTRTFSKAHGMAGIRLGYALGQRATVRAISRYRNGLGMSVPGVAAGVASLSDAAHIDQERARNTAVRAFTVKAFTDLGFTSVESQANFLFVNLGRPIAPFRDACKDAGVLVGREFPPYANSHCRISLGTMDEMQRAVAVFRTLLGTTKGER
jgi:Histidinol-phosphate/aromatic aminotransferase and cobyric acid decarboxylase